MRHCLQIVVVVVVVVPREWLSQAPADESGGSGSFSFSFGGFCCVRQNRTEESEREVCKSIGMAEWLKAQAKQSEPNRAEPK